MGQGDELGILPRFCEELFERIKCCNEVIIKILFICCYIMLGCIDCGEIYMPMNALDVIRILKALSSFLFFPEYNLISVQTTSYHKLRNCLTCSNSTSYKCYNYKLVCLDQY